MKVLDLRRKRKGKGSNGKLERESKISIAFSVHIVAVSVYLLHSFRNIFPHAKLIYANTIH